MLIIQQTSLNVNFQFSIHQATLDYIGGIDPSLRWQARGISGYDSEQQAQEKLDEHVNKANEFLNSPPGRKKLKNFLGECNEVFLKLINSNNPSINDYLGNKNIIFIIGAMRTGGTYLYTELNNVFDIEWEQLSRKMTHDSIPSYDYLLNWEQMGNWLYLAFELAQFLVWAKRECTEQPVIIQKRIGYAHCLPILNNLFESQAQYVITIRHPGSIAASFKILKSNDFNLNNSTWKNFIKDLPRNFEFEKLTYNQKILFYWQKYYLDIANYGLPEGNCFLLNYGKDEYEQFIKDIAIKWGNKEYEPDDFKITERDYSKFWRSKQVEEVINQVQELWQINDLEFPDLELR